MGRKPKNPNLGRPPAFKSPADLDAKLNEAFNFLESKDITFNLPDIIGYLGVSQRTWERYQDKKSGFLSVIKRAEGRIEAQVTRLLLKHPAGQIFYMKNKHAWQDKQEITRIDQPRDLDRSEQDRIRHIAQQAAAAYLKEQRNGNKSVKVVGK